MGASLLALRLYTQVQEDLVGLFVGDLVVGDLVGLLVGYLVGLLVGYLVGLLVGRLDGLFVGRLSWALREGLSCVGDVVGLLMGYLVGLFVGDFVGLAGVCDADGTSVSASGFRSPPTTTILPLAFTSPLTKGVVWVESIRTDTSSTGVSRISMDTSARAMCELRL